MAKTAQAQQASKPLFVAVPNSRSGIAWVHDNAMTEQHYLPETMSGGVAFLDYDSDGWMDIYLVNSGKSSFYTPPKALSNALYRNNGDGTFSDVTARAGVRGGTFGMGAAAGDFDNDGYPDLFVTAAGGKTLLYRNRGDGTFADITRKAGVEVEGWTTSAAWFDFDNDGWLDLFVCSFVEFSADKHISCGLNPLGKSFYCVPRVFRPTVSFLFRNNGNGTFSQASTGTVIGRRPGKALGVVAADINGDGLMDLWVANDTVQDFLYINRGSNQWEEAGLFAGVGLSPEGAVQSGMGVDAADVDSDGLQDLFVANIDHQYYSLFKNNGDESFQDLAPASELGRATFLLSGWGLKLFDFDNDGDIDLLQANGHPDNMIDAYASNVTYKQPLLLFRNQGGILKDISKLAGPVFSESFSSRGLAVADYDNDGRIDALINNIGDAPLLLANRSGRAHHWIGLKLVGIHCNRDAIGAQVSWSANGVKRSIFKNGGGSYLASHDQRLVLGLGSASRADWVEVKWPQPSGLVQRLTDLPVDRYLSIEEGKGILQR
ncbi:MAG: CRTAC1 family protein [Acidobacteriota bacterium]